MLVLSRTVGESILIVLPDQQTIEVHLNKIVGKQVKLGIVAPADFKVYRREVYETLD